MAAHVDELRAQARALPEAPGVYFWKDGVGKTLYIGKAVNLRARVTSYFSNAKRDRRTRELLLRARSLDYEVAATELQALFRESSLIKQEQPKFNRALKQPRRFWYLKLDGSVQDPYLESAREVLDDGSLYFGPFRSGGVMRETMQFLHEVLPLRKCTRAKPKCPPCLYYQMNRCAGPLIDDLHRERHAEAIGKLVDLLDGRADRVRSWLQSKRDRLSDLLLFERAAEIQIRLDALEQLVQRQTILEAATECRCVLVHEPADKHGEERLLLVAHGTVVSQRVYGGEQPEAILSWLRAHGPLVRTLLHRQSELDAASVLERWLVVHRDRVKWVAIPYDANDVDLLDRVAYVLLNSARYRSEDSEGQAGR